MNAKLKINDLVRHFSNPEIFKVIEVIEGNNMFKYRLQSDEDIKIEPIPENELIKIEN